MGVKKNKTGENREERMRKVLEEKVRKRWKYDKWKEQSHQKRKGRREEGSLAKGTKWRPDEKVEKEVKSSEWRRRENKREVKRRDSFWWAADLPEGPGSLSPRVTLCSWAEPPRDAWPLSEPRGPRVTLPKQPYNSAPHLHSVIYHKVHSHRYPCLRLRARRILNCNFYNSAQFLLLNVPSRLPLCCVSAFKSAHAHFSSASASNSSP